jgi:hypothetical protein
MCTVLRIPVDIDQIYRNEDPGYFVWLDMVIDRTLAIHKEANARAERAK